MGFEERAEVSRGEERWDARQGNRDNGMVGAGGGVVNSTELVSGI